MECKYVAVIVILYSFIFTFLCFFLLKSQLKPDYSSAVALPQYTETNQIENKCEDVQMISTPIKWTVSMYIDSFAVVAQMEEAMYGIPTSITLGQGILESSAGNSRLAKSNNNHFGIKCFSKKCRKGHCSNFDDDHHKDFFRAYQSVEESYRAHSMLLTGRRYKELLIHGTDYSEWANGLQRLGYATDTTYAEKLIMLIEINNIQWLDVGF